LLGSAALQYNSLPLAAAADLLSAPQTNACPHVRRAASAAARDTSPSFDSKVSDSHGNIVSTTITTQPLIQLLKNIPCHLKMNPNNADIQIFNTLAALFNAAGLRTKPVGHNNRGFMT
jgi:hypothetical protein